MTTAEPTRLIFYHDVYDPHSISMLFICRALLQRFNKSIQIQPMLVTNSSIQVYGPHSAQFNIKDATLQSKYYEIPLNLPLSTDHLYPHNSKQKNKLYQLSNSILCQYINIGLYQNDNATTVNTNTLQFLETAINISNILWNSHISLSEKYDKLLTMNNVKLSTNQTTEIINYCLNDMRHYLSGNIYLPIRKQWFPRVDRLLFLLQKLNIKYVENERWNDVFTFKNPFIMNKTNILYGSSFNEILHVWVSFRSPYSWLIMNRLNEIVCKNKLKLKLYPILPAIFRNVEISPNKGFYIGVIDCPRIAKYLNISYGPICDPAKDKNGKITFDNINLCLMVFVYAKSKMKENEYFYNVMKAIWSKAIFVGNENEMEKIVNKIDGLNWNEYCNDFRSKYLNNDQHLQLAKNNLDCLLKEGQWGVPSIKYRNHTYWGQDRLWALPMICQTPKAKL